MKTRMDKYTEVPNLKSRTAKNKNLYEQIKNSDIEKFELNNNATIIGEDIASIDVNKIKDMLDKRYREDLNREIELPKQNEETETKKIQNTKEYDINVILEKARETQDVDYEKERLKKVHDTQYDILKKLNINEEKNELIEDSEENIMNLINTITALEMRNKEQTGNTTALDLLSDLTDNDTETVYKTMELDKEKISEKTEENLDEEDLTIEQRYDDFKELEKDLKSNNIAIKIVTVVIVIIILLFVLIFFNNYFNLGLF